MPKVEKEDRYPKTAKFDTTVSRTHSRLLTSLLKTAIPVCHIDRRRGDDNDDDDGFSEFKQGRSTGRKDRRKEAAKQPTKLRECQFSARQKQASKRADNAWDGVEGGGAAAATAAP